MGAMRRGIFGLVSLLAATIIQAGVLPQADFPPGWSNWPVVKEGRIPAKGEPLNDLPPIVRETFKTYEWINDGQGSAYAIRFNPDKQDGKDYGSGPTAVFHIKELGVLLVTGHLRGVASVYGVYTDNGKDI